MGAIQAAGGFTIAQSPDTCVVDSMPRSAIERGFATRVVSLSSLAAILQSKSAPENLNEPKSSTSSVDEATGASRRR
jgi:chemotaxis response regulator CheB